MPPLPEAIRFPDTMEYELRHWEEILTRTVEWLNRSRIMTLANVPVGMVRGSGYLINTEPVHSDGRPMVKRTQAGGPDELWVYTKSPATPGYYAVYHVRRLLELFRQDLAQVHLPLPGGEETLPFPEAEQAVTR